MKPSEKELLRQIIKEKEGKAKQQAYKDALKGK